MYCVRKAIATHNPATKPPPGRLWPRMKKYRAITTAMGSSRRTNTAGTIM